ncbi:hypothetical protein [Bacillus taeanensis]|nr:hypothetical protein [Bacillus taeanensis]
MKAAEEEAAGNSLAKDLQKLIQRVDNGEMDCAKSCIEELKHILKGVF